MFPQRGSGYPASTRYPRHPLLSDAEYAAWREGRLQQSPCSILTTMEIIREYALALFPPAVRGSAQHIAERLNNDFIPPPSPGQPIVPVIEPNEPPPITPPTPAHAVQAKRIADLIESSKLNTFSSLDEHNIWGSAR